jgi:hypothetical protein
MYSMSWFVKLLTKLPYKHCKQCPLAWGHATAHQHQPTFHEWYRAWMYQGREG